MPRFRPPNRQTKTLLLLITFLGIQVLIVRTYYKPERFDSDILQETKPQCPDTTFCNQTLDQKGQKWETSATGGVQDAESSSSRVETENQDQRTLVPRSPITEWHHPICGCQRPLQAPSDVGSEQQLSTCGPAADIRGPHQRVISYAFYGDTKSGYFKGVAKNAKSISELYPGWTMRLYHDVSPADRQGTERLCAVVCEYSILDDCNVPDLKSRLQIDLHSKFGMLWRFVVLGDPLVDVFSSRDLDSPVYQREVDAVNDWLGSNKTWHVMRDNIAHFTTMLGGMWGVRNSNNFSAMVALRIVLLNEAGRGFKGYDQTLLTKLVYPTASKSLVAHDSFLCQSFKDTRPFPSQRVNRTFVGDMYGVTITRECPLACRPANHQDWKYC